MAIMQPYLFPYIGYFQLVNAVDKFVIYDDVQYIKSGWINRNKLLINNNIKIFSISLKKASTFSQINEREISDLKERECKKIIKMLQQSYAKAPQYENVFPLIKKILLYDNNNLASYITNSLTKISKYLGIQTDFVISSTLKNDKQIEAKSRLVDICHYFSADHYINLIGGMKLYQKDFFQSNGIKLNFLNSKDILYQQFKVPFVPNLSIIDVLMFNSITEIQKMLNNYSLI